MKWDAAIAAEVRSLTDRKTFTVITVIDKVSSSINLVDSKWVFKIKYHTNGLVDTYKARLCARGFTQQPGLDFDDTWAPTGKYNILCLFISLSAYYDLEIHVVDAVTAFLNSKLDKPLMFGIHSDCETFDFLQPAL
jgi:hypothetical protein